MSEISENNPSYVTIALDAMGGDFGPETVVPGAAMVLEDHPKVRFLIYGDAKRISEALQEYPDLNAASDIIHCEKMVKNDEKPSAALRGSKGTSMRLAIEAVSDNKAQAVVSAGNTGALMAMAKMILKPLPGIHRPAIASLMPTQKGDCVMLDLGANVLVDAENLAQFAVLGSVFSKAHTKKTTKPTVGLLNVGSEETKGPEHIRSAASILSNVEFPGQYCGFVEGDDITKGTVDVIVCDGYAGNIALKTIEGAGRLMSHFFKESFKSDPLALIGGVFAYFAFKRFKRRVDPRLYNGGVFLGLNGLCIKSHGGSDAVGFSSAIRRSVELVKHGYIDTVSSEINHLMEQESFLSEARLEG